MWRLLRGRCAVRPRLGRPGAYNRAPGRRRVWLPREPAAVSVWSPGWDAAKQGSSLGWTGAGAGKRGAALGGWCRPTPRSVLEASTWRSVPRVPLAPPCAVRSSDQRSSGCAAVLVMLLRHGNHVCGAVSVAQVLQEGASRLPHWPTGAEWMEEASGDVSASPGLEPRPTGHFRAWPECSGSCPTWARASWEDGRTFPEGMLARGQEGHWLGHQGVSGPMTEAGARGVLTGLLGGRSCFSPSWFGGCGVRGTQQRPLYPHGRGRALVRWWPAGVWVGGRQSPATMDMRPAPVGLRRPLLSRVLVLSSTHP